MIKITLSIVIGIWQEVITDWMSERQIDLHSCAAHSITSLWERHFGHSCPELARVPDNVSQLVERTEVRGHE
jgi:hypothetical protein